MPMPPGLRLTLDQQWVVLGGLGLRSGARSPLMTTSPGRALSSSP